MCGSQRECIARHNHIRDVLFTTASSANLGPTKEERALIPGRGNKPADILIPHWAKGRAAALDVTVVNPLAPSYLTHSKNTAGYAMEQAFTRKYREVGAACRAEGIEFIPMPTESLGGMHDTTVQQVKKLGAALALSSGSDQAEQTKFLFQMISLLQKRDIASLILNRNPETISPEVDGIA